MNPRKAYYVRDDASLLKVMTHLDKRSGSGGDIKNQSVTFASRDGVLDRAGVRHVVFRAETIHLLLSIACDHKDYYDKCRQIGQTAANDLWQLFLNAGEEVVVIPRDLEWLVRVWGEWDTSGGWGKFTFHRATRSRDHVDRMDYHASVENNFLRRARGESVIVGAADMHQFWCGYIHGFLEDAIVHAYEPIYETECPDAAHRRIALYPTVLNVTPMNPDDVMSTTERFVVRLVRDPLLPLWDHLGRAHAARFARNPILTLLQCQTAALWAKEHATTRAAFQKALQEDQDGISLSSLHQEVVTKLTRGEHRNDEAFAEAAYLATKAMAVLLRELSEEVGV